MVMTGQNGSTMHQVARRSAAVALMAFALLAAGCGRSTYRVSVTLVSDLEPGTQTSIAKADFITGGYMATSSSVVGVYERPLERGDSLLHGISVAAIENVPAGAYTIHATLVRPNGNVLMQRDVFVKVDGDSAFTVYLTANCAGVMCPNTSDVALSSCFSGQCADPRCTPDTPQYCPASSVCHSDADCVSESSMCEMGKCVGGTCLAVPSPTACAVTEFCAQVAGCAPVVTPTLPATTSTDPRCGTSCALPNSCRYGFYACPGNSSPTCTDVGARPAGAPCGLGAECDSNSSCVASVPDGGVDASMDATIADGSVDASMDATIADATIDAPLDAGIDSSPLLADATIDAAIPMHSLQVSLVGPGSGSVDFNGDEAVCGPTCSVSYAEGSMVTLMALPDGYSDFGSWSGCTFSDGLTCTVVISGDTVVTAQFAARSADLRIEIAGTGIGGTVPLITSPSADTSGTVPAGTAPFSATTSVRVGQVVVLYANPPAYAQFVGWSATHGGPSCTGTGACRFLVPPSGLTVTATFAQSANITFVTSNTYNGDLTLAADMLGGAGPGALASPNMLCQHAATSANLPGTFKAWISDDVTSAAVNVIGMPVGAPPGYWVTPRGDFVAATIGDLVAAGRALTGPRHYLNVTEAGDTISTNFETWSNTAADGTIKSPSQSCSNWTTALSAFTGHLGNVLEGAQCWTDGTLCGFGMPNQQCSVPHRLTCFSADGAFTAPAFTHKDWTAFLSTATWTPGGGVSGADSICQSEASGAELPGTYRAYLALTTGGPATRFATTTENLFRSDGLPLGTPDAFYSAAATYMGSSYIGYTPLAPINQNASASMAFGFAGTYAWTGTEFGGNPTSPVLATQNCNDWTYGGSSTATYSGTCGQVNAGPQWDSFDATFSCSNAAHLYCIRSN